MYKITLRRSLSKGLLSLIFLCLSLVIISAWPVSSAGQSQDRTVTKFRNGKLPPPVEIKAIKTKRKIAKIGETIFDDDDWFDGLTVSIENTSGKTIIYVGGGFLFPKPRKAGVAEPPWYHTFNYGRHPGVSNTIRLTNLPLSVKSGEVFDITVSNSDYVSIKQRLKQFGHPESVSEIKFNVEEIYYDDGTAWIVGIIYERDANDPEKYRRKDSQINLQVKKREPGYIYDSKFQRLESGVR